MQKSGVSYRNLEKGSQQNAKLGGDQMQPQRRQFSNALTPLHGRNVFRKELRGLGLPKAMRRFSGKESSTELQDSSWTGESKKCPQKA